MDSECRLFADDTLLSNSQATKAVLQKILMVFQKYAKDWQPTFNVSKFAVLLQSETKTQRPITSYVINA